MYKRTLRFARPVRVLRVSPNVRAHTTETAPRPITRLVDSRNVTWDLDPSYQEEDATKDGWFLMRSSRGETLTYVDVVEQHGFRDVRFEREMPYLIGYVDTATSD